MNMSPSITHLATALSQLNGELENITKNKSVSVKGDKGSYSYTYADLASVLEDVRPTLLKLGLAVHQAPETLENKMVVTTTVLHSSGEWISSSLFLPVAGSTAQAHGSAITFARRYALLAALGIATEDDDGAGSAVVTQPKAGKPIAPTPNPEEDTARADLYRKICERKGKTSSAVQNAFISGVLSSKSLSELEDMLAT